MVAVHVDPAIGKQAGVPAGAELTMLMLPGAGQATGYLVRRALDIVTVPDELLPAADPRVRGVAMIDGAPVVRNGQMSSVRPAAFGHGYWLKDVSRFVVDDVSTQRIGVQKVTSLDAHRPPRLRCRTTSASSTRPCRG